MEFMDEDRPRFVFQSKPLSTSSSSSLDQQLQQQHEKPTKLFLFITITISSILLLLSILYLQTEPFKSLLFWLSLSLLLGPFAPSNLTGGQVRVGHGPILEEEEEEEEEEEGSMTQQQQSEKIQQENKKKTLQRRSNSKPVIRSDSEETPASLPVINSNGGMRRERNDVVLRESDSGEVRESAWSEEDIEMLKKQLVKNPVGKPGRWEAITEAFKGRHRVESVIKKAKELSERKLDGKNDDYAQFLKNRKQMDRRMESGNELVIENGDDSRKDSGAILWSSREDIALLNALKAFPKEVAMRWEKIAAAVPGKSKAACMKRVAELKKEFRSSKAVAAES